MSGATETIAESEHRALDQAKSRIEKKAAHVNEKIVVALAVPLIAVLFFAAAKHVHGRSPKRNAAPQQDTGPPQPVSAGSQSRPAGAVPTAHTSHRPLNFALLASGFTTVLLILLFRKLKWLRPASSSRAE